jgi:hypothetical protein
MTFVAIINEQYRIIVATAVVITIALVAYAEFAKRIVNLETKNYLKG